MPARNALVNVVYIAENYLGVVKIVFADSSTWLEVGQVAGIWWKAIFIPCGNCPVVAQTDGIKLRALLPQQSCDNCLEIEEQHDNFNGTAFPTPIHPQRLRWVRGPGPIPQRMSSFICNGQASVGISTYSNAAWVFTPLDEGELIAEIWWATEVLGTDTALGFRTNKGREVFMGYPARLEHEEWTWRLVDQPRREEHQIFYESSSLDNIKSIAFDSREVTMDGINNFDPVRAINRLPDFLHCQDDFFYTSASLNSVVQVTACRAPDTSAITGMMLQYDNGHKEGLGEVRLDCLDTPIQVGGEGREKLWLRFQYDPSGIVDEHPRLVEMQFFPLGAVSDTETVAWYTCLELSWEGQLEWWWNPQQCQVFYGDKGSLEPRDADLWLEAAR
ncbi:hypothetical protein NM208_g4267 [Fusarium decemcellulare]|uniref:Uncharacterized protein n=1 Tax=Fusarium decemcellulare TaxID=57161 RepID=A0ACC1SLL9_9HYPO|nr:hypothetical protein NM208_g4267 [Fusarium decemcellulare]